MSSHSRGSLSNDALGTAPLMSAVSGRRFAANGKRYVEAQGIPEKPGKAVPRPPLGTEGNPISNFRERLAR